MAAGVLVGAEEEATERKCRGLRLEIATRGSYIVEILGKAG
jgi:hypothetical protein